MKSRDFRLFWWAEFLSQITGMAAGFAIPLIVYRETGSLAVAGTVATASAIVGLVFGLLGGSLADMRDRKKIALVCESLDVILYLSIAVMLASGTVNIVAMAGLLCVQAATGALSGASTDPALPQLVSKENLPRARGLLQARMHIANLLGPLPLNCSPLVGLRNQFLTSEEYFF